MTFEVRVVMLSVYVLPRTVGGVELHIYHLARALARLGVTPQIVQPVINASGTRVEIEREQLDDIPVIRVCVPSKLAGLQQTLQNHLSDSAVSYLGGFLSKSSYNALGAVVGRAITDVVPNLDILHQHDFSSSLRVSRLLSRRVPCVLTNHTGEFLFIRRNPLLRWSLRPILSHYKAIIAPSRELSDVGYEDPRVRYIPNGVDVETFQPVDSDKKALLRMRMNIDANDLVVICARRWAPTKGIKTLIEAIPHVRTRVSRRVRFLMVGSDYDQYAAYRAEVIQRIQELGIKDDVMMVGNTASPARMAEYFNVSDVAVLPSLMEATSLAGLEAMSSGLPVVATNVGGLPEIIDQGETGLLVPAEDPSELATALVAVLTDPDLRLRMGQRGRTSAVKHYSWHTIAQQTLAVYNGVLPPNG